MTDAFMIYRMGTSYEPKIDDFPLNKDPTCITCECCPPRFYSLTSGRAKTCPACGVLMARVGQNIALVKVQS